MRDVATYKLPKTHVATLCIFALLTQRCYGVMIVPTKAREPQDLTAREAGRGKAKMTRTEITIERGVNYRIYLSGGIYFVDYFGIKCDGFSTIEGARGSVYYHNN